MCGMREFDPDAPKVPLRFARDLSSAVERRAERAVVAGDAVRVRAGVFATSDAWDTSSAERFRARIRAAVRTRRRGDVTLGFEAAAIAHGLPRLGRWPEHVSLIDLAGTRPPSRRGIRWHQSALESEDVVEMRGILITSRVRTLLDIARVRDLAGAVIALDHALHTAPDPAGLHRDLLARLGTLGSLRGIRAAREAVVFADGRAESPGESLSRVRMHELGFLIPEIQVPMPRPDGPADVVDFDWAELGTFGEMDGEGKYLRDEYTRGRDAATVVAEEKRREDRIRRRHRPFCLRWGWNDALHPEGLAAILAEGRIPRVRRPSTSSISDRFAA